MFHLKSHLPSQKPILSNVSIDTMQNSTVSTGDGLYGLGWWVDREFPRISQSLRAGWYLTIVSLAHADSIGRHSGRGSSEYWYKAATYGH